MAPDVLSARWTDLAVVSYFCDPAVILDYLPAAAEVDLFDGQAVLSLVGFRFEQTKIAGLPVPLFGNFSQINLRFYVRAEFAGKLQPAVVFIKEICPFRLVEKAARLLYGENYLACPTKFAISADRTRSSFQARVNGGLQRIELCGSGTFSAPQPGSLDAFLLERYHGCCKLPDATNQFWIEHRPWRCRAAEAHIDFDFARVYGAPFGRALKAPCSVLQVDGSEVKVSRPQKIPLRPLR